MMKMSEYFVFSSGGGRQSSAALVLSAYGIFPYKTHIFCNVGDDSEDRSTLDWVHNVLMPYADKNGVEFIEARKSGKTLLASIKSTQYSIPIPAKLHYENGKKSIGMRACTNDWKIRVSDLTIRNMYGNKTNQSTVHVGLGISLDEIHRAKTKPIQPMGASKVSDNGKNVYWYKIQEYPMIFCKEFELFGEIFSRNDVGLTADDCTKIVALAGLGTPPKSACWFCPFHSVSYWKDLYKTNGKMFENAVELEVLLSKKEDNMAKKHAEEGKPFNRFSVYLSDAKTSLVQLPIIGNVQENELDNCDSGYCMV